MNLIGDFVKILSDKNSLILDSFAGTGTTAHAVLKTNAEDGGERKFILVEMDDKIANSVTAERITKAIKGYKFNSKKVDGLGGSFTYCTLGEAVELEKILLGKSLPSYDSLAPVIFHMATNQTLESSNVRPSDFFCWRGWK